MTGVVGSESDTMSLRPRTRQRTYKEPPPLAIPNIDENAAERKRVLNVLAQRRYRERKRMNRLKAKSGTGPTSKDAVTQEERNASASSSPEGPRDTIRDSSSITHPSPNSRRSVGTTDLDFTFAAWDLNEAAFASLLPEDPLAEFNRSDESGDDQLGQTSFSTLDLTLGDSFGVNPSSDVGIDSYNLPMTEVSLIRAMVRIAERLNSKASLWTLDCNSAFNSGTATPSEHLPAAWRPTASQVMIPHHPLLDFLPWPGVRDRIINILTLPDDMRPPNAVGPLGMVNFAYDVEHTAEGVRIFGENVYDPTGWEVGQILFERWWFLFDREIIETSNRWRRLRGAAPLRIGGGSGTPDSGSVSSLRV